MYFILLLAISWPLATTIFLFRKKEILLDEDFGKRYGSLYKNIKTYRVSRKENLFWITFFLVKRLYVAILTVWVRTFSWA